ncbi:MAG: hypothetical protein ACLFWD_11875 [Anaerolineales bacterium]
MTRRILGTLIVLVILTAGFGAPGNSAAAVIPITAGDDGGGQAVQTAAGPSTFTALSDFAGMLPQGDSDIPVGVYVPGILAYEIHTQPALDPGYVTSSEGAVSLFRQAQQHGTTGLIAHNYLAGELFFNLGVGQEVVILKADGARQRYRIESIRRLQALSPWSPNSNFVDLDREGHVMTALELFNQIYHGSDRVIFQTCIEYEGNPVWGRLFVTATPIETSPGIDWAVKLPAVLFGGSYPNA